MKTLFALNLILPVLSKCPVLNLFKYKSNLSDNVVRSNVSDNVVRSNVSDNVVRSNVSDNIVTGNVSDNVVRSNVSDNVVRGNVSDNVVMSNVSDNIVQSNVSDNIVTGNVTDGKATFYFRINDNVNGCPDVQTFNDGNNYGPCNNYRGVQYNTDSKYWCAIKNSKDYCGKSIVVYYKENQINLKVMDECPSCNNNIDMSLEALIELTGSKENACAINQQLPDVKWKILL
jgi:hypothetical protein